VGGPGNRSKPKKYCENERRDVVRTKPQGPGPPAGGALIFKVGKEKDLRKVLGAE